jgi:CBS-domain-containing membrane protein
MTEIKRVSEVMIPLDKYPHIPYWFTLRQAIAELEKSELEINGRKSLPRVILVFDEKYRLMGMVRRRDLMRGLEAEFLAAASKDYYKKLFDIKVDPNLTELSYDHVIKGIRERAERPVSDVMFPIDRTVESDDHIMKAIYEMVDGNLSLLPVLKQGRIVGVVRSVDVFHEIAQLVL